MCILFFAYDEHPKYRLVVAANRDEFFKRPTAAAAPWADQPDIIAGRDLEGFGTWMGVNRKTGYFAALTNFRGRPKDGHSERGFRSRGELVSHYLQRSEAPESYLSDVAQRVGAYQGFNLVLADSESMYYYSSTNNSIEKLSSGIYGLSNAALNTPWPKVEKGKVAFESALTASDINIYKLFQILVDAEVAADDRLPNTGVGLEWERTLSPIFINSPHYGTRASTILMMTYDHHIQFIERTYHNSSCEWTEVSYSS
ncbi:NRDE family protein [Ammoniphilus sp. YIM 78166]|uniref:NRDE family protein n=1 Tax=Ammoniphilus sp. YIM 78166 TaxID=1644106 RepID=UPI0010702AD7|nr:NRDE family protein [Ammoniphilus sp. YIM 78166]